MKVGLFVHGKYFMYRIGKTIYASCGYVINRCSTPQLVYIKKIFKSLFANYNSHYGAGYFFSKRALNIICELTTVS